MHHATPAAIAAALIAALLFVCAERRAGAGAMIPLPLLRNRRLNVNNAVMMAMTFSMYGVLFLLPLSWLCTGALSAFEAGLPSLPMSLTHVALSHYSGAWSARFGVSPLIALGMVMIGAGLIALACTRAGQPVWLAEPALFATGVGVALGTAPLLATATAIAAVEPARAGTAAGMVNSARMVGATLGVGVLGSVFAAQGSAAAGFGVAMAIGAAVAVRYCRDSGNFRRKLDRYMI